MDLPVWQGLFEELAPDGLAMFAVALDDSTERALPWVEAAGATFTAVLDAERVVAELYGIFHVPTVVWIDEGGRVVRPNDVAFGDDRLIDFHGVASAPHHEALRRWVREDIAPLAPDAVCAQQVQPSASDQLARTEFALALQLHRRGRAAA